MKPVILDPRWLLYAAPVLFAAAALVFVFFRRR